ncbi:hypothetical protein [Desmospora profundinema]|uniref:Uncharacterized protein n=1 Tax=Desmospora profundinema TaxID=1571184 RepID=A0ABU1IS64_9BACL|nr:hypothetical protein [Desmospora profundinema]MDR6227627.1 hypothetical protein [Desmospora profundinema]
MLCQLFIIIYLFFWLTKWIKKINDDFYIDKGNEKEKKRVYKLFIFVLGGAISGFVGYYLVDFIILTLTSILYIFKKMILLFNHWIPVLAQIFPSYIPMWIRYYIITFIMVSSFYIVIDMVLRKLYINFLPLAFDILKNRVIDNHPMLVRIIKLELIIEKAIMKIIIGIRYNVISIRSGPNDSDDEKLLFDILRGSKVTVWKIMNMLIKQVSLYNILIWILVIIVYNQIPPDRIYPFILDGISAIKEIIMKENKMLLIILKNISPVLTLIGILLALRYYLGEKGKIARQITKSNNTKWEKVIDTHRQLLSLVGDLIQKSTRNVSYANDIKDLIINQCVSRYTYEDIDEISQSKVEWSDENRFIPLFHKEYEFEKFEEIPEIEKILEILKKAEEDNVSDWLWRLQIYEYNVMYFFRLFGRINIMDSKILNESLFTKQGFEIWENKIKERLPRKIKNKEFQYRKYNIKNKRSIYERIVLEVRDDELDNYNKRIVKAIENLVYLGCYYNSVYSMLNSFSFGDRIKNLLEGGSSKG